MQSLTRKRKAADHSPVPQRQKIDDPPKNGERPIIPMQLSWSGGGEQTILILLDTGATIPVLAKQFVHRHGVPCRQREAALPISTFDGSTLPGIGKEFTQRLQLRHGHHVTLEAFEVGPLEMSSDAILPNWWMQRHPPINIWSANTATIPFTDPECQLRCTSHVPGTFPIEYEPSLVDKTMETTSIGCLGYLRVNTAGTADIDWNVLRVGTQRIVGAVAISVESTAALEEWIPEEY